MSNQQSNSTTTMVVDDETLGAASTALDNQIDAINAQIDVVKDDIKAENILVRAQRRTNFPVVDTSKLDLLRKTLAIRKSQVKRLRQRKEKLEKDGVLERENQPHGKKTTDREKILRLKEKIQKLTSENNEQIQKLTTENNEQRKMIEKNEKRHSEEMRKAKEILKVKEERIKGLKEEIKISGWESRYLLDQITQVTKKPMQLPSDTQLQNYINKCTNVTIKRNITFN